jgi:hypothetical protein
VAKQACSRQSGERGIQAERAANRNEPALPILDSGAEGGPLQNHVLVNRAVYDAAAELIDRFGEHALAEAANRAETSRGLGNVIHFCHWRETERAIELLSGGGGSATVH